jgi:hypothetical protein
MHIHAHTLRQTVASLLLPGIVSHSSQNEDASGANAQEGHVTQHKAHQSSHNTGLTGLHLCSKVNPDLLSWLREEGNKAL